MQGLLPPSSSVTGSEVLCRSLQNDATDRAVAGVEDVVPLLTKERGGFGNPSLDDSDRVPIQVLGYPPREQCRRVWRNLGGLDHDAVASRNRADEWQNGSLKWVVPGGDDHDDPERLAMHDTAPGHGDDGSRDALRLHPGGEALPSESDLGQYTADLRAIGFHLGFPKVRPQGREDVVLALPEQVFERVELRESPVQMLGRPRIEIAAKHPRDRGGMVLNIGSDVGDQV